MPNTIDFDYIFAAASFEDNLTIYFTVIFTMLCLIFVMTWARIHDIKDKERLVTFQCPDNKEEDGYMYEILTFTGNWKGSSCDSGVSFVLTGEDEQTPIRVLDKGRKDTLRKGTVDSYLLKVPRPLGALNYIRIWHDNTGYDDFGSWFCSAIVIKDLQTEAKYEFVLNKWLALERGDGEV